MSFAHRLAMALVCPICKSPAQELSRSGDATGFYCTEPENLAFAPPYRDALPTNSSCDHL
jgi:hypothetical protein